MNLAVAVDGWFDEFAGEVRDAGFLPDLGFAAYCSQPPQQKISYALIHRMSPEQRVAFNALLFDSVMIHHLNAVEIAFWGPTPCWKCHRPFSAHSLVSKQVRVMESCTTTTGITATGLEQVGMFDAEFAYYGQGSPLVMMPYGIEHLDKMLAITWRRLLDIPELVTSLPAPAALLAFTHSPSYGNAYWALNCPHCAALQGEHFLKRHPNLSVADAARAPMQGDPVLVATPTIEAVPVVGGKVYSRLIALP